MRQRVKLAQALVHDPELLILDEPLTGMDPIMRRRTIRLIKDWSRAGKSILVSSHILPELADICNKIGIIERGKLEFDGTVEEAIRQVRKNTVYLVSVANEQNPTAREHLEGHLDVMKVEDVPDQRCLRVTLADGVTDGGFLVDVLLKNGLRLKMFKEEEIDLEDVFLEIMQGPPRSIEQVQVAR